MDSRFDLWYYNIINCMEKYTDEREKKYLSKLRKEVLPLLPRFCVDFFVGISSTTTVLTRYNYATDLVAFFTYLCSDTGCLYGKKPEEVSVEDIKTIRSLDIERFLDYLNGYYSPINGDYVKNSDKAKSRKLSAVRCLFKFLYTHDMIDQNVTTKVAMPKLREKEIIRMENDEVINVFELLDKESTFVSNQQNSYNNHNTKIRDNAILSLLLGTGIRVSECVGLNVSDLNFANKSFLITRKGEKQSILYMNDEIIETLNEYLDARKIRLEAKHISPESVDALFLSLQNKRITVRAVEMIVKKYTEIVNPLKKITPHKLRSTYGTALYRETNDIYVVAEVLGHKDINTTKKHYAAISEDIKKSAADKVNFKKMSKDD